MELYKISAKTLVIIVSFLLITECATTFVDIREWEKTGNVTKLSEVARKKSESAHIRKKSLESLARLNWKPTNPERLQVYAVFASSQNYSEAVSLMQVLSAERFTKIDKAVIDCVSCLDNDGSWSNSVEGRGLYYNLRLQNNKAVTISLCQQVVARPKMQTRLILLAIKLGIEGSQDELNAVLFEYGDKAMAEDYLNSGSGTLVEGAQSWAVSNGYNIVRFGSHRVRWGSF